MTQYLWIIARQRPFPYMVDENGRVKFSVNFEARALAPVDRWEYELAALIHGAGLGTLGVDLFIGPGAVLPKDVGPYVQIIDTGGRDPEETHDAVKYENLSVQIIVTATAFSVGDTRALAIWRLLDGQRNVTVSS